MRPEALSNLLLASAPLLGFKGADNRAPYFAHAWWDGMRSQASLHPVLTEANSRTLLLCVLALCEAEGITRADLVATFNDSAFAEGDTPDEALQRLIGALANFLIARRPQPKDEVA